MSLLSLRWWLATSIIPTPTNSASFVAEKLGWAADTLPSASTAWQTDPPSHIPSKFISTMLLLCFWQLWKHRNGVVFRGERPDLQRLLLLCKTECRLWSCRFPRHSEEILIIGVVFFQ
ncbi:hypothetical protein BS78_05G040400 [Paspalum vaginatum]|nr:hypothetical protein BS78_05G040400 [Paspalum vaginatum]